MRVTVAALTKAGRQQPAFHHILSAADRSGPEPNVYHLPVTLPAGAETVAVLVEPLAGGGWGGQVVTLGGGAPAEPAAISVARPGIRLVAPSGASLAGKIRLRVNGDGKGIARVDLKLGDRTAASCAQVPCEAEVDLGRRVRPQIVQGVAYDAAGQELARDWVRLNDPNESFGVRIVEPAGRQARGPGRRRGRRAGAVRPADREGGDLLERRAGGHPLRAAVPASHHRAAQPPAGLPAGRRPARRRLHGRGRHAPQRLRPGLADRRPPGPARRGGDRRQRPAGPGAAEGVLPRPPGRPAAGDLGLRERRRAAADPGARHRQLGEHVPQAAGRAQGGRLAPRDRPQRPRPGDADRFRLQAPAAPAGDPRPRRGLRGPGAAPARRRHLALGGDLLLARAVAGDLGAQGAGGLLGRHRRGGARHLLRSA